MTGERTETAPPRTTAVSQTTIDLQDLTRRVEAELGRRLLDFRVDTVDNFLVLRGRAASYHVKQLVQTVVMQETAHPILRNLIEVV